MSASLGVGGALGLPTAAFIADNWDWHILFWTSAALMMVLILVPLKAVELGASPSLGVGLIGVWGLLGVLLVTASAARRGY